jgi:hypothetical protein
MTPSHFVVCFAVQNIFNLMGTCLTIVVFPAFAFEVLVKKSFPRPMSWLLPFAFF